LSTFQPPFFPFFFAISIHLLTDSSSPSSLPSQRPDGKKRTPDGAISLLPSLLRFGRSLERARNDSKRPRPHREPLWSPKGDTETENARCSSQTSLTRPGWAVLRAELRPPSDPPQEDRPRMTPLTDLTTRTKSPWHRLFFAASFATRLVA
jgi:hypothetical protein